MSELQTRFIDDAYVEYYNTGKHELAQIYLKSEADKVIAEKDAVIEEMEERIDELQKATDSAWSKVNAMYDELRHQKYKRCLAMSKMCQARYDVEDVKVNGHCASWDYTTSSEMKYWERWRKRWLELAEKFKEAKL